jgi:hypothetical protein
MIFNSEEDAYQYWEESYYLSGGGYEGTGLSYDGRVELFNDWVDDQAVSWLDDDTQQFIREWDAEHE